MSLLVESLEPSAEDLVQEWMEVLEERLNPREMDVLRMRLGLFDDRPYSTEEIAVIFGVTRERIRQIEAKVVRIIRQIRGQGRRRRRIRDYYADMPKQEEDKHDEGTV